MSVKVAGNFLINALKSGQKTINVKELPKSLKKYTKEVAGQRDALAKAVKNKPRRTKKIIVLVILTQSKKGCVHFFVL